MWPVEMSMLGGAGSSDQDEVLLRAQGLGIVPSLTCDDTLLTRDVCGASGQSDVRTAMRCRHSSWKTGGQWDQCQPNAVGSGAVGSDAVCLPPFSATCSS